MTIVESANLRTRILDDRMWDILINRIETQQGAIHFFRLTRRSLL